MATAFLLCRECLVVHPVFAAYELAARGRVCEETAIAYGEFLVEHRHHRLERVERHGLQEHHSRPLWDPSRVSFLEVSSGREIFTIRSLRDSIEEPRRYEVANGHIQTDPARVTIEEAEIRRALDHHFYPNALRPTKVDDFIQALREVLADLAGQDFDSAFDDANDPCVSIARLPDEGCVALLERCMGIFDAWELSRVASFVSANRDEYGALALRVHRESSVSLASEKSSH
jgi:hypothetical protein